MHFHHILGHYFALWMPASIMNRSSRKFLKYMNNYYLANYHIQPDYAKWFKYHFSLSEELIIIVSVIVIMWDARYGEIYNV